MCVQNHESGLNYGRQLLGRLQSIHTNSKERQHKKVYTSFWCKYIRHISQVFRVSAEDEIQSDRNRKNSGREFYCSAARKTGSISGRTPNNRVVRFVIAEHIIATIVVDTILHVCFIWFFSHFYKYLHVDGGIVEPV